MQISHNEVFAAANAMFLRTCFHCFQRNTRPPGRPNNWIFVKLMQSLMYAGVELPVITRVVSAVVVGQGETRLCLFLAAF